jgi:hypothetical protein
MIKQVVRVVSVQLAVLAVAAGAFGQGANAYDPPMVTNTEDAIPVGPFLFSPAVQLTWQHRDNIFFTPDDPVSDEVYLARASFVFELPIYESYVRFSYTPVYRDYKDYQLQENWSHFVDLSGAFEFSNGLVFDAIYRYVQGSMETREVDPGDELIFGDRPFKKNFFKAGLDYWFTARDGISLVGDYTDVAYDESLSSPDPGEGEYQFYDYERTHLGLGWVHQISPVLTMDVMYGRIEFEPVNTLAWRTSTSDQITAGFKGQLSAVWSTEIRLGWRETQYEPFEGEQIVDDFSGAIVEGHLAWDLAHGSSLRLDLLRSDYPSNFGVNAYYTATGGALSYNLDRGNVFGLLRGRYQNNDYVLRDLATGDDRSDDITSLTFALGYRLTRLFSLYGSYLYEDRSSTIYRYSYDTNIFTIGLTIGY